MADMFVSGDAIVLVNHKEEGMLWEPAYPKYSNHHYHHLHDLWVLINKVGQS